MNLKYRNMKGIKVKSRYNRITLVILLLISIPLLFLAYTCDKEPETIYFREESEHFVLHATSKVTTQEEMAKVIEKSESLFPKISAFLGDMHKPEVKIQLWLEGDMINRGSYVDFDGVHLYRYNVADGGYLAVLAHEMVHAFIAPWFIEVIFRTDLEIDSPARYGEA